MQVDPNPINWLKNVYLHTAWRTALRVGHSGLVSYLHLDWISCVDKGCE